MPRSQQPMLQGGQKLEVAIPILRIFSVDKAKEFYVDFLGFKIDWEHRFGDNFPLYCQVSRLGLRLHLSEHHGDASPGSTVFIWMRGIAEYNRELLAKNYRYYKPGVEDAPWDAQGDGGGRPVRQQAALQRAEQSRRSASRACRVGRVTAKPVTQQFEVQRCWVTR